MNGTIGTVIAVVVVVVLVVYLGLRSRAKSRREERVDPAMGAAEQVVGVLAQLVEDVRGGSDRVVKAQGATIRCLPVGSNRNAYEQPAIEVQAPADLYAALVRLLGTVAPTTWRIVSLSGRGASTTFHVLV